MVEVAESGIDFGNLIRRTGQPALITLVVDVTERIRVVRRLQELQDQLREQAIHDPVTGLYNRVPPGEFLDRELCLAQRHGYAVTVVLADLDHFKAVNDPYGHLAGDEFLRTFGKLIKRQCRASDLCCRYAGEEFLVVLPNMRNEEGIHRADEFRAAVATRPIVLGTSIVSVTASFGVATYPEHGPTRDALIAAADKALYEAKGGEGGIECVGSGMGRLGRSRAGAVSYISLL